MSAARMQRFSAGLLCSIVCAMAGAPSLVMGIGPSAGAAHASRHTGVPSSVPPAAATAASGVSAAPAAPAASCPQAHAIADIDSEDFTSVSARSADAVFDCLALTANERAALTVYRARAKPLGARSSFDAWFLSADVAVSDALLFNSADAFFDQEPQPVKDAWPSLKEKLVELFSDRRLAFDQVDETKKVLDLHWRSFETELSAADDFLGLENDRFVPNRQPIVGTGFTSTFDQLLAAGSKFPDPVGKGAKALAGVWDLLNLALNRAPPVDVGNTGQVVSGQTGRSRLGITVANLRLNYEQDYLARAAALANLKTFIVRDPGLLDELADQRASDITSGMQASAFATESTLRVRKQIIETLLPIRGVLYGTDITRHMAMIFVSEPQRDFGPDKDLQTGLTLRLAPHFPVGRTWMGGAAVFNQARRGFCPLQRTTRSVGSKQIVDEPCADHLAYSGYRYWEGDKPEGEFQVWRLAFAGGENEIPRLATEGMSAVPGFNSPFEWISSVMHGDEIFNLLVNARGRFLIQQPPLDCQPAAPFGWQCTSERISAPVRDERSYVRLPLPDWGRNGMADATGPNILQMNLAGRFRSMRSVSYWPPTSQDGRFSYTMMRYFPEGRSETIQRCYGEGGQGQTCRDFQKAVMVPSNWIVLKDGNIKLPVPVREAPPFQSNMMIKARGHGQCLEVDLDTPVDGAGRPVVTARCTGGPQQLWTMNSPSASPITIAGQGGQRLCLDVDDSTPAGPTVRQVKALPCKPAIIIRISNQAWTVGSDGTLQARSGFPITARALTTVLPGGVPVADEAKLAVLATPPSPGARNLQQWSFERQPARQ